MLSIKKASIDYKLGIKDITGHYIYDTSNNFSLENIIHIERIISIKDLELANSRERLYTEFKKELYACFGLTL